MYLLMLLILLLFLYIAAISIILWVEIYVAPANMLKAFLYPDLHQRSTSNPSAISCTHLGLL